MKLEKKFPLKRVIITGAGSGLGRCLALEFAGRGWRVAVSDISKTRMAETAAEVNAAGGKALGILCDVTKPKEIGKALKTLEKQWGGVDVVINNAGVAAGGFMEKIPVEEWNWIIDINLKSVIFGCRAFIPLLKNQKSGHIINVASNAGIASLAEMSSYNVTKAAVISLSETLRIELAPHNVGVTVVCPTFFKTNLMDQFKSTDERQRKLAEEMFAKANTSAEKIARHVVRSVERRKLYVLTQFDAKLSWRSKRLTPETYFRFLGWAYRKGLFEKYTGVK
jgi:NAD(P)-dependent dehydrogenase (short-subunit alcohol dehydrogenase family)